MISRVFLNDYDVTPLLAYLINEYGKRKSAGENPNYLIHSSIVDGELVAQEDEELDYFFATIYPAVEYQPETKKLPEIKARPAAIGLYAKSGPRRDPFVSGIRLPIKPDGSFDEEAYRRSGHEGHDDQAAAALEYGLSRLSSALEAQFSEALPYPLDSLAA